MFRRPLRIRALRRPLLVIGTACLLFPAASAALLAQSSGPAGPSVPKLSEVMGQPRSELADVVVRFATDRSALERRYDAPDSPAQRARMRRFYREWSDALGQLDFDVLGVDGRTDYVLLDNLLTYRLRLLDRQDAMRAETAPLLPFADRVLALQDARRDLEPVEPRAAAALLAEVAGEVDSLTALVKRGPEAFSDMSGAVANRAAEAATGLRRVLGDWHGFYDGFDPVFTWWTREPYARLDAALGRYARQIRESLVGLPAAAADRSPTNEGPIIGDPIGAAGLQADLEKEMIPYTPEELIAIAEREYAFSLQEMKKASREMGFGDDWKAAMEEVKERAVAPGEQPAVIRDLAREAERWFAEHDWITIPPLADEDWRMDMLSPERQRVSPFFLGGERILVSYPTDAMTHEEKLMSMRGNNPHFSRATVFHELNPGHHLQGFMRARYQTHRQSFSTPFWNEGQSLYWEMFLWDHGFQQKPEDRIGALFWRMHRSARIIFSLSFHLGTMTPPEAIDFLVDRVNFERANAEAEVRRSFNGSYPPLYQMAYMIGGLQLRALHEELVASGRMEERAFHDAVIQGGPMPIAMVRARLAGLPISRGGVAPWRFADALPAPVPAPVPVR